MEPQAQREAFAQLAEQARAALDGAPPPADQDAGPFAGSAADGLVRAEVAVDGTVRSLFIEQEMYKHPLADVAGAARAAINAALDARPGQADFAPVIAQVRAAQDETRRGLTAITQGMADVERSVRASREGKR